MPAQSRMIERADKQSRRMPSRGSLLAAAEDRLREGNVYAALQLFRAIVKRYPSSLEELAASAYLRDA